MRAGGAKAPPFHETFIGTLVAPGRRPAANAEIMKKNLRKPANATRTDRGDILLEYDFSRARPNKYASRYQKGASVVTLDPDVAAVFQNPGEVNEALRALAGIIHKHGRLGPSPSRNP